MAELLEFPGLARRREIQAMVLEQHLVFQLVSRRAARDLRVAAKPRGSLRGSQSPLRQAAIHICEDPLVGYHWNLKCALEDEACRRDMAKARLVGWVPM